MALYVLYLSKSITDTETRIYVGGAKLLKRGMLILIGNERMRIMRKHRDGSLTVKRGVMGTEPTNVQILETAVGGDAASFKPKRTMGKRQ